MKELKELKDLNRTMTAIKDFTIAQAQMVRNILMEIKSLREDIRKMEGKHD